MNPAQHTAERSLPDEELVARTLGGERDAFTRIVERYQTLICSVAYNATGNLAHSQDLAQETFIAGWKQIRQLREPARLRSWLCGIAHTLIKNRRRRLATEPAHLGAELGDDVAAAADLAPSEVAIKREQEAILWQALERIPEDYRQPLILFYREHRSIERVALALDLSEDAVKQRLSRGRKLLQQQVLAFVEGTLAQTAPGPMFTAAVIGALPLLATSSIATMATAGGAAAKWGAAGLGSKLLLVFNVVIGPVVGLVGTWFSVRASFKATRTPAEGKLIKRYWMAIAASAAVLGLGSGFLASGFLNTSLRANATHQALIVSCWIALFLAYAGWVFFFAHHTKRRFTQLRIQERRLHPEAYEGLAVAPSFAVLEYRSRARLLGLPLVHVRFGATPETADKLAKGWIALGDYAVGVLFAFGGVAVGGVSIGGISAGLVAIGGVSTGLFALGGVAIGVCAVGGVAVGDVAVGGLTMAWHAAQGLFAVSREFALSNFGSAPHLNDAAAQAWFAARPWFDLRTTIGKAVLSLTWLPMLILLWRAVRGRFARRNQTY